MNARRLSDIVKDPRHEDACRSAESAYRRGVHQAAARIYDDLRRCARVGYTAKQMLERVGLWEDLARAMREHREHCPNCIDDLVVRLGARVSEPSSEPFEPNAPH